MPSLGSDSRATPVAAPGPSGIAGGGGSGSSENKSGTLSPARSSYFDQYPERRAKGPYIVSEKLTQPLKRRESKEGSSTTTVVPQQAINASQSKVASTAALFGLGITNATMRSIPKSTVSESIAGGSSTEPSGSKTRTEAQTTTKPISRAASTTKNNDAELYAALRRDLGIGSSSRTTAGGNGASPGNSSFSKTSSSRYATSPNLAPIEDASPETGPSQRSSPLPPKAALTYPRSPARSTSRPSISSTDTLQSSSKRSQPVSTVKDRSNSKQKGSEHLGELPSSSASRTSSAQISRSSSRTTAPPPVPRLSNTKEAVPSIDEIIRRSTSTSGLAGALGLSPPSRADRLMDRESAAVSPSPSSRSSNDCISSYDSSAQSMYTAFSSLDGGRTPSVRSSRVTSARPSIEAEAIVDGRSSREVTSQRERLSDVQEGSVGNSTARRSMGAHTNGSVSISSTTTRTSFGANSSGDTTVPALLRSTMISSSGRKESLESGSSTKVSTTRPGTASSSSTAISEEDQESDSLSISSVDSIEQEIRASLRVSKTRERALRSAEKARRQEEEAKERSARLEDERRAAERSAAMAGGTPRKELHHAVSFPTRPGKTAPHMRASISSPGRRRTASSASSTSSIRKAVIDGGLSTPLPSVERFSIGSASAAATDETSALARFLRSARLTRLVQLQRGPHAGCTASVADVGDPVGHPVMIFLGLGAVRYLVALYDEMASALGLRLICVDRWGMGRTDDVPDEKRSVLGWADVVIEVADQLDVKRFSVLAHSAGAPYAMGTVLAYPDRIAGPAHLLAPWVSAGLETGYKWLKYVPDGVIRTAQAAEWRMQGWRLGKMPSLTYEGVGNDGAPTRLVPPPSPAHTSRSSPSPSPTPDTLDSHSPITPSLSLRSGSSRGPSPLPSLCSPQAPQFLRTSPTVGSENLPDIQPTWPTKSRDADMVPLVKTSGAETGGQARGSAESYISVPSMQPDGTRTPTLVNGDRERGTTEFGAFIDGSERSPQAEQTPRTPSTPGRKSLKSKSSFLNGILRSRSSNGSSMRAAAVAAAAKGDLPPLPDGLAGPDRRPSNASVDTKRNFGSGSLGRSSGAGVSVGLVRASSDSRRSSMDPRPSLSAEIGLADRYLALGAGRPSESWEDDVRTELAHVREREVSNGSNGTGARAERTPTLSAHAGWGSTPSVRSFSSSQISLVSNASGAFSRGLIPPVYRSYSSRTEMSSSTTSLGGWGRSSRDKDTPPLPLPNGGAASSDTPTRASSQWSARKTPRSRTTTANTTSSSAASSTSNLSLLPGAMQSTASLTPPLPLPIDLPTALLRASHAESLKGGAADLLCILGRSSAQPWGFTFKDITSEVKVWHGDRDERISLAGARWMEKEMSACKLKVVKGAGHGLMTNIEVVVEALESIAETKVGLEELDDTVRRTYTPRP